MALTDISTPDYTVTEAAGDIREKIADIVNLTEIRLHEIRNLVRQYGRSAIAAELGSDSQDMLTVYTKLKEAIESAKQIAVEDLP